MLLKFLEQQRHQHTVLAAADTNGHLITRLQQSVFVQSSSKTAPNFFMKLLVNTVLHLFRFIRLKVQALHQVAVVAAL